MSRRGRADLAHDLRGAGCLPAETTAAASRTARPLPRVISDLRLEQWHATAAWSAGWTGPASGTG